MIRRRAAERMAGAGRTDHSWARASGSGCSTAGGAGTPRTEATEVLTSAFGDAGAVVAAACAGHAWPGRSPCTTWRWTSRRGSAPMTARHPRRRARAVAAGRAAAKTAKRPSTSATAPKRSRPRAGQAGGPRPLARLVADGQRVIVRVILLLALIGSAAVVFYGLFMDRTGQAIALTVAGLIVLGVTPSSSRSAWPSAPSARVRTGEASGRWRARSWAACSRWPPRSRLRAPSCTATSSSTRSARGSDRHVPVLAATIGTPVLGIGGVPALGGTLPGPRAPIV